MLIEIAEQIQDAEKSIARLNTELSRNPKSEPILLNLDALYARRDDLERRFSEIASEDSLDVCSYRFIFERGARKPILPVSNVLAHFQLLYSQVYAALKGGGPRKTAKLSAEFVSESTLEFGYTFSGSLGFVFTMPNERLVINESLVDEAMSIVFDLMKAKNADGIRKFATKLGPASIRALYKWSSSQIESMSSADIKWRREETVRSERLIQIPELKGLCSIIAETSDVEEKIVQLEGELVAGNLRTRTFEFKAVNAEPVRGVLSEDFQPTIKGISRGELLLGHGYRAKLKRQSTVSYSTDEEKVEYTLMSLVSL